MMDARFELHSLFFLHRLKCVLTLFEIKNPDRNCGEYMESVIWQES
jgi:hypothetical protein